MTEVGKIKTGSGFYFHVFQRAEVLVFLCTGTFVKKDKAANDASRRVASRMPMSTARTYGMGRTRTRTGERVRMQTSDEQVPVHTTEKDSTDRERDFVGDDYCLCVHFVLIARFVWCRWAIVFDAFIEGGDDAWILCQ